jgi:hypothetical protein
MYAKVFRQIFDSTVSDDWRIRTVWMHLLVLADRNGIVDMTPEAIGRTTGLPQEMVDYALEELAKPDGRSRSFEEEGRRIVLLCPDERTWGWRLVNYAKYRDMLDEGDRLRHATGTGRSKKMWICCLRRCDKARLVVSSNPWARAKEIEASVAWRVLGDRAAMGRLRSRLRTTADADGWMPAESLLAELAEIANRSRTSASNARKSVSCGKATDRAVASSGDVTDNSPNGNSATKQLRSTTDVLRSTSVVPAGTTKYYEGTTKKSVVLRSTGSNYEGPTSAGPDSVCRHTEDERDKSVSPTETQDVLRTTTKKVRSTTNNYEGTTKQLRSCFVVNRSSLYTDTDTDTDTERESTRAGSGDREETKRFLAMVFGRRPNAWSYEEEQLLMEILPLRGEDRSMIERWFGLPEDHPVFEATRRKQTLTSFLRDFNAEMDKMRRFASKFMPKQVKAHSEPEKWREFFRWKYGEDVRLPKKFVELHKDQQAEYHRDIDTFLKSAKK